MAIERTLSIIKPDATRRNLTGKINAKFEDAGLHALAWGEQGFRHITSNRGAIQAPADLDGLKIRTMENPVHIEAFRALGAAPTPMAWPEVIGALQQGAIDGQENPLSVIVSAKLNEVQEYLTLDGHVYSSTIILVSPSLWGQLDDTQKAAFEKAADDAVVAMRAFVDEVDASGVEAMKAAGAKRALMLPVSAPFHSVLMQPAAAVMADALAGVDIQPPAVPLVANVRAEAVTEPGAIRRLLVEQVTGTVRWRESIATMAEGGVTEFWEIGAGKALSGMIKRIAKDVTVRNVGTPADVATLKG